MAISTKRGTLDLTKHMDQQYINTVLQMGSWCIDTSYGYIVHMCKSTTKQLKLHRLVYELAYGPIPAGLSIDHIDGNKSNNFLSNLRVVTHQENHFNRTTAKGYYWNKPRKKWLAQIRLNGKQKHLGLFDNESEARQAYLDAKKIHHIIQDSTTY